MKQINAVIVEDEEWAALELEKHLLALSPNIRIMTTLATVESTISYFRSLPANRYPNLIFMDINLGDGESFSIFKEIKITCPVIFTTAYDQYTLKAFKNQGIDYLLKPIDVDELRYALEKYENLTLSPLPAPAHLTYQQRFMVKSGLRLKSISIDEIAYFMAEDRYLYLVSRDNERFILDDTIKSLESRLSTHKFFRINRKFIIQISSIKEMVGISRNRVKIFLDPAPSISTDVVVSEDRSEAFRAWLNS